MARVYLIFITEINSLANRPPVLDPWIWYGREHLKKKGLDRERGLSLILCHLLLPFFCRMFLFHGLFFKAFMPKAWFISVLSHIGLTSLDRNLLQFLVSLKIIRYLINPKLLKIVTI